MATYRQPFKAEWPVTQGYGEKYTSSFHTGIDYGCPLNTPILASADGVVVFAAWESTGYGNAVIIQHDDGRATLYAHLSDISVSVGTTVRQGTLLGHSGSTGNSTGPHLHFEARTKWWNYNTHFDPMTLPLMTVADDLPSGPALIEADSFAEGDILEISCLAGAWVHNAEFTDKTGYVKGSRFEFTGKTIERDGLTFCECRLPKVWIAVHNGSVQILKKV